MMRLFIDSSVLFSAAYSSHGHSRDLLRMGIRGDILPVVSRFVLIETRRNLESHDQDLAILFDWVAENTPLEMVEPTKREVRAAAKYVDLKDAPIAAAARKGRVDMLVTLDKKHLLGRLSPVQFVGSSIVTPKDAIGKLTANQPH